MNQEDPSPAPIPERNPSASLTGTAKRTYVRGMFTRIADHYDIMNTLMTFGQDERWRAVVVRAAGPVAGQWTLDVGTGTGLIARDLACVTTGFTMRNVVDIETAFREMHRVVKPGGRVICLEVATPRNPLFRMGNYIYTRRIIPLLGRIIAGDADAYSYLPNSMGKFPPPPRLAQIMETVGLRRVRYRLLMMGSVAIHVGIKP
jgi:demethylmenaquinone methyltransferase/2-methoxy-6-polyprenyl-1,4-benzoquinol methylase